MAIEDVSRIVALLRAQPESVLELNQIGEAVGSASVSHEEIEQIFVELEASGKTIGKPIAGAAGHLPSVLSAARELKKELGQSPSVEQTAERAGLSVGEVRMALLFVQVMQR